MDPADEMAAKIEPTEHQSAGAVAGSIDKLDEQLRVSVEALLHPSPPPKPVEELDDLLSGISHHLDDEASERKAIYNRLVAIENEMKTRGSRGFARYLVAFCIGVAAILAWQSYGEAAKQIIATKAPEFGWSPETKQMIASWIQQFGWTKPPAVENTAVRPTAPETPQAASVTQTPPETVAPNAPAAPSLDPEQVHQITLDLAALRQTVEQLAAAQDQMAREMTRLEAADMEILAKIPAPPPPRPAAPARKPMPVPPPTSRVPIAPPTSRATIPPH
jgi:hypothetical protein